jgi:anhydro-N-acetylmuramic acid kinase
MNKNLEKLYQTGQKNARVILGLMSGTSFDGLDLALCRISGSGRDTCVDLLHFDTVSYQPAFKESLKSVFSRRDADLEKVCLLNNHVAIEHARMINDTLAKWGVKNENVDLIASHGQTIYHAPAFLHGRPDYGNATLQIGDGDHIAVHTGIISISDFRQKHVAAGGEGAPLAVYGDYLVFSKKGENRIMLNIGGIANFTYLPGDLDAGKVFSTDVGPGNTMMDALMQSIYPEQYYDQDAGVARKGTVHPALLTALKAHAFFDGPFPKTIGPELFNLDYLQKAMQTAGTGVLSAEDQMATLSQLSADMIVDAINRTVDMKNPFTVYVSGGGMHNPLLMENIREQLKGIPFHSTQALEINPDAKEAVLFALLANETVAGGAVRLGENRKGIPNVSMGKISFPD